MSSLSITCLHTHRLVWSWFGLTLPWCNLGLNHTKSWSYLGLSTIWSWLRWSLLQHYKLLACESTLSIYLKRILKEQRQHEKTLQRECFMQDLWGFLNLPHLSVFFLCIPFLTVSDSPSRSSTVGLCVVTRGLRSGSFWSSLCLSSCTDSCTALIWCWNIAKPLNAPTGTPLWPNGAET